MLHKCIGTYPRKLILESLGKRSKRGVNRYTKGESEETTKELARRIGTSGKCIDYADKCLKSLQRHETY